MPPKRTILHIIANLDYGGAASQMHRLAVWQQANGFDVHIRAGIGGPLEDELRDSSLNVESVEYRGPFDLPALWKLRREVKRLKPAVIHAWGDNVHALLAVARVAAGNASVIVTLLRPNPRKTRFERALENCNYDRCRRIVVQSVAHRDLLLGWDYPPEKVLAIPGGTPPSSQSRITRRQLLDMLDLPQHSRLAAAIGRLELRKQLKDAIWAADLLKVIRDDVHLLIIGDGPHRDRLHKFRDQVEIRDKVHFLGENSSDWRGDVADLLPHLDVFWSASSHEGHSAATLEAMAAGVPVVAADIPGNRELIEPDATGYLFPVGDRAGLAQATNRLLNDADLAKRIGTAARQHVESNFSAEKMLDAYAAVYEELP